MTQLTHWIPERWREALVDLRDDIYDVMQRWVLRRQDSATMPSGQVAVLSPHRLDGREERESLARLFHHTPGIDLDETDDEVVVMADLPGLDHNDFRVELRGERLVIHGEKKQERQGEQYGYRYHERHYGAFTRAVRLPCEVDADKAHADYKRGVLRVTLPKTEGAKAKRVKVQIQA